MAPDILGQRLHREVGAVFERLEQQRRAPGVVAADEGALGLGGPHDGGHVLHFHRAGARRFHPDQLRARVDQLGDPSAD